MNIFKKRKNKNTITLHCYTCDPLVFEYAKIQKAAHYFPKWWHDTPKIVGEHATIKNCIAIQEFYKKGIVIPSWFTAEITVHTKNHPEGLSYSYLQSYTEQEFTLSHGGDQYPNVARQGYANMKINSPWYIKTDEEIYFHWGDPYYNKFDNHLEGMDILPAVTNFKFQHETNINYFLNNNNDKEIFNKIEAFDPLVILHPMTEKNIEVETHLVSAEEMRKLFPQDWFVIIEKDPRIVKSVYSQKKKVLNKIEERKQSKCPFGKL